MGVHSPKIFLFHVCASAFWVYLLSILVIPTNTVSVLAFLPPLNHRRQPIRYPSQSLQQATTSTTTSSPSASAKQQAENVGFEYWVSDAPDEVVTPLELKVKGQIPEYLQGGTLIRNGGAIWSLDNTTKSAHIFDGLAKLSRYHFGEDGGVQFSTRLVDSKMKKRYLEAKPALPTVHIGPLYDTTTKGGYSQTNWWQALPQILQFDNAPVNVWDYQPHSPQHKLIDCLTDTPIRATVDATTLDTLTRARAPPLPRNFRGYELSATAHPEYCKQGSGATYNVGVHIGLFHNCLCLMRDESGPNRHVVASYQLPNREIPYLHSFGVTPTKAVIVLQPLRQASLPKVLQDGFLPTMVDVGYTQVVVMDLKTGQVVADPILEEPVYFYHVISATDDDANPEIGTSDVSIKVCGYRVPDLITGPDQFFRFDRAGTKEGRNRIHPGGELCHVAVQIQENSATVQWTPVQVVVDDKKIKQGFELPTTRYSRTSNGQGPWRNCQHPQYAYAFGAFACGSSEYDAWGIFKIDTTTGEALHYRDDNSCYYSEPIFVAKPTPMDDNETEDDGVLLCTRFDGRTQQTSLLIIDAQTMKLTAEACTNTRVAMDFHGAFLPPP